MNKERGVKVERKPTMEAGEIASTHNSVTAMKGKVRRIATIYNCNHTDKKKKLPESSFGC